MITPEHISGVDLETRRRVLRAKSDLAHIYMGNTSGNPEVVIAFYANQLGVSTQEFLGMIASTDIADDIDPEGAVE